MVPAQPPRVQTATAAGGLWLALGVSGTAAIANQVLWQRGLGVVGAGDTLATSLAVLVFMAGLGLGGLWAAARGRSLGEPMRALAAIELCLCVINAAIAWLLHQPAGETGVGVLWRWTLGSPWLLAAVAIALLTPPTLLMGATLPLAADARQRAAPGTAGARRREITMLFVVNAAGAVIGAAGTGLWLLPHVGQLRSLLCASALSAAAACVLWLARPPRPARPARPAIEPEDGDGGDDRSATREALPWSRGAPTAEEWMGLWLGLLSLGYEMYLVRLMTLHHGPYPYTFALTLCGFLLCWSIGAHAAARRQTPIATRSAALATAAAIAAGALLSGATRSDDPGALQHGAAVFSLLPVTGFGLLYGTLVSSGNADWRRDVGRFYALNTLGACIGILAFTFVGYELRHAHNAFVIAVGLVAIAWLPAARRPALARALCAVVVLSVGLSGWAPHGRASADRMAFHGRDGVVELDRGGNVMVDGLWHSRLSTEGNHIGKLYNWGMAVTGVLARGERPLRRALVVGNGVGITAATLARVPGLHIDAYEINRTLGAVMRRYPERTLHAASHPRIDIRWRDGRAGLLTDPRRYDLIVSSPLHLSQAGSTLLLSVEYLELVRRRLTDGGVVVLFSDEGHAAQAAMVAATVHSRFAHVASFDRQLITLASDRPLSLTADDYAAALRRPDPLMRQLAQHERERSDAGKPSLWDRFDGPLARPPATTPLITDDRPVVEYPRFR